MRGDHMHSLPLPQIHSLGRGQVRSFNIPGYMLCACVIVHACMLA